MTQPATWFITGTSSGFGRALTKQLLADGRRVIATLRRDGALADLQTRYGEHLHVLTLDVTDAAAVREVLDTAFAFAGRIDVIVNNAGYGLFGAAEELSDEQIDAQLATNLLGSMHVIRAALPHLRSQGGGRVLQVSSAGGQIAYPNFSVYHASKWGIEGFVEAVAQEVAPFGIEFTIIEPGAAKTAFGAGLVSPPPSSVYADTPSGHLRKAIADGAFELRGDSRKIARAMIDCAAETPAPKRLALGTDTYTLIRAALTERLANLDAYRDIALSTDADA